VFAKRKLHTKLQQLYNTTINTMCCTGVRMLAVSKLPAYPEKGEVS